MSARDALIVRAFAVWTVFVWVTRIGNVLRDEERDAAFKAVHVGLAVVSVGLAVAAWAAVARSRRAASRTS